MIANAAARAISGRGAPSAFRIACSSHARGAHASAGSKSADVDEAGAELPESQQEQKALAKESRVHDTQHLRKKGPYRSNKIWGPNMKIDSRMTVSFAVRSQRRTFASKPPRHADQARQGDSPSAQEPVSNANQESPPPEFQSQLRQKAEESNIDNEALNEFESSQKPTGPLPDLRQGIPSSFDASTSETSPSVKDRDAELLGLNLTTDPAGPRGRSEDDGPKEEYVSSIERRRNAIAYYMFLLAGISGLAGALYLGRDWENEAEARAHPDVPNGYSPLAIYNRITERLRNLFGHYTEPAFAKLLPDPSPDPNLRAPYTLVLSLEDLLVSSKWDRANGYTVAKRPGVDYFLRYMSQYYELVIFTTVLPMNADGVLRKLDPFRFCIPLFRDATRYMEGEHVKDLSYLNRDLSKTIIIDTVPAHVKLQPENAIVLPKWKGDIKDPSRGDLVALIPFLEYIASMSIEDVRKVLKSYEGKHIPSEFHRRESKAREEFNKRLAEEKSKRPKLGGGLAGLSSALGLKPALMTIPGEQSPLEGFAEGKMLSDQMRERGQRQYQEMEKQLRENGEMWLKQQEEEDKKMQEEATRNMTGWLPFFGGRPPGEESAGGKEEKER